MAPRFDNEDPITGAIAFERVLDRLLEETRENHVARERGVDREELLRTEQAAKMAALRENQLLKEQVARALPKLMEFYAAAEAVRDMIADQHDPTTLKSTVDPKHETLARLRKAMAEAETFCEVPF